MLADCESCEPTVVHLVNCGEGEVLEQRKASVELYLKTSEGANKLHEKPGTVGPGDIETYSAEVTIPGGGGPSVKAPSAKKGSAKKSSKKGGK
jgi:hypothetical protein